MIPTPSPVQRGARLLCLVAVSVTLLFTAARAQDSAPGSSSTPAIVDRPLPPPSNDTPEEQPSLLHVWVPGHWRWSQGSYVWVTGRWQLPPVPHATWVPPQWESQGSAYVLRQGYWLQNPPGALSQAQSSGANETTQPPPPPRPELIPESPSPAHAWQPGFWEWRGNQFVWVDGRWEIPPRQNMAWVPHRWETRGDRYALAPGYWRESTVVVPTPPPAPPQQTPVVVAQPAPTQQVVVVAPPPPQTEIVYAQPSRDHVWVPGYWAWRDDRYVWVAGHWARPPHGRKQWEAPRWERRDGHYVFIDGHWR